MDTAVSPVLTSREVIGSFLIGNNATLSEDSEFEGMPVATALTKKSERLGLLQILQATFPDNQEVKLTDIEYMTFGELAERFAGKAREIMNLPHFELFVADYLELPGPAEQRVKGIMPIAEVFPSVESLAGFLGLYFTNEEISSIGEIILYRQGWIRDLWLIWATLGWARENFSPILEEISLYLGERAPHLKVAMPIVEVFINEAYFYGFLEKLKNEFGARLPNYLLNMRQRNDFYRTARLRDLVAACRSPLRSSA